MLQLFRRLTEGRQSWGVVDRSPAYRGLWCEVRLTVYPPGTTAAQRRLFHAVHSWPIAGVIAGMVLMVALGPTVPAAFELGAGGALYAAGFAVGAVLLRPFGNRMRRLAAVITASAGDWHADGDIELIAATLARFAALDDRRQAGALSPAGYEAEWGAIYDTLPSPLSAGSGRTDGASV
ncbi:MAG TPA: DUF6611 family protein [Microbacteriaceae bacterium]